MKTAWDYLLYIKRQAELAESCFTIAIEALEAVVAETKGRSCAHDGAPCFIEKSRSALTKLKTMRVANEENSEVTP